MYFEIDRRSDQKLRLVARVDALAHWTAVRSTCKSYRYATCNRIEHKTPYFIFTIMVYCKKYKGGSDVTLSKTHSSSTVLLLSSVLLSWHSKSLPPVIKGAIAWQNNYSYTSVREVIYQSGYQHLLIVVFTLLCYAFSSGLESSAPPAHLRLSECHD